MRNLRKEMKGLSSPRKLKTLRRLKSMVRIYGTLDLSNPHVIAAINRKNVRKPIVVSSMEEAEEKGLISKVKSIFK